MAAETVTVEGLPELIRALGRCDKAAASELRKELKDTVGAKFAVDARDKVVSEGLLFTGALMRSIKPFVSGADVVVRSSPPLKPGPRSRMGYAAVYEYGAPSRGARPFLEPTYQSWLSSGKLEHELDGYLDFIQREFRA